MLSVQVATPENRAGRVLVVDDEASVCETIRSVLALDHHEVRTATSSQEALRAFQESKFDLVIVDYRMPVMNGDEIAAAMKALVPQQPILLMTGYGEALRLEGSFPLPVDKVMMKPFVAQEFRDTVCQLVAKT